MTPSAKRRHIEMLVLASVAVAGAFGLQVHGEEQVETRFLVNWALPPSCVSRQWFGVECPACGLTRSLVLLAKADWENAWRMHHLGWLMGIAILLQFPYRIFALAAGRAAPLGRQIPRLFGLALIAALLGNWLIGRF